MLLKYGILFYTQSYSSAPLRSIILQGNISNRERSPFIVLFIKRSLFKQTLSKLSAFIQKRKYQSIQCRHPSLLSYSHARFLSSIKLSLSFCCISFTPYFSCYIISYLTIVYLFFLLFRLLTFLHISIQHLYYHIMGAALGQNSHSKKRVS